MTAAPGLNFASNKRRWRDLSGLRITIALLLGPTLSLVLLVGIVNLTSIMFFPDWYSGFEKADLELCALMNAYWLLAGWCYLMLISRWRGIVSRAECLLLGMSMTLVAPPILALPWLIISSPTGARIELVIENALYAARTEPGLASAYMLGFGLVFLPFWVLSGWLLWRIGVRPASASLTDAAAVFE